MAIINHFKIRQALGFWLLMMMNLTIQGQEPVFQSITVENGLPSNYVTAMLFDSKGYFWVGTDKGLVRLNGSATKTWTTDDGLGGNLINLLFEDKQGYIWVGCNEGGLTSIAFNNGQINFSEPVASHLRLFKLTQDSKGGYWIKARDMQNSSVLNLYHTQNLAAPWQHVLTFRYLDQVDVGNNGAIYFSMADSIQWHNDSYKIFKHVQLEPWVEKVIFSNAKFLKQGKKRIEVYNHQNESNTLLYRDSLPFDLFPSYRFSASDTKDIFVKTGFENIFYENGKRDTTLHAPKYGQIFIHDLAIADNYGNIFLSRFGEGIYVFYQNYLTRYRMEEMPKRIKGDKERVLVNSYKNLYTFYTFSEKRTLLPYPELSYINFSFPSKEGKVIVAGNMKFNRSSSYFFKKMPTRFTDFSDGLFWNDAYYISSYSTGIGRFKDEKFDSLWSRSLHLPSQCIERLEGHNGKLYALTLSKGLFEIDPDNGKLKVFDLTSGLPSNAVYDVFAEQDTLWIGTRNGVSKLVNGRITTLTGQDGFVGTRVLCLFKDISGRLLVLSDQFLHLLQHDRLYALRNYPVIFGNDGPMQAAAYQSNSNDLWILSTQHVYRMALDNIFHSKQLAALDLDYISMGNKVIMNHQNKLFVENNHEPLQIQFKGPLYSVYTRPVVYGMLEGFEKQWKRIEDDYRVTYPKLPTGNYTFIMKTLGAENNGDQIRKLFTIRVLPPWWKSQKFLIPFGLMLAFGIFYLTRYMYLRQFQQKINMIEARQALQTERLRIGRELHDNVGSMLTLIINKAEDLPVDQNRKEKDIAFIAKRTLAQLRDTIWALDKENITILQWTHHVQDYLHAFQEAGKGFQVHFDWQDDLNLNPLNALHSFRILQESISNAIKHAHATSISVVGNNKGRLIVLEIKDNGIGFKANEVKKGFGLKNMQRRADEMKAGMEIKAIPGEGTAVKLSWESD